MKRTTRMIRHLSLWLIAAALVFGCTTQSQSQEVQSGKTDKAANDWFAQQQANHKNPTIAHYNPPQEYLDRLLKEAQAADKARQQAKENGPTVTIVNNGKATATIVAGEDAKSAAGLLNQWIKLMSGATLPVADQAKGGQPAIYLGQAAQKAGLDLSGIKSQSNEGIRIKSDGKQVLIGWQDGAAPARAVGRFLEEQFGCRWIATTDWGRVYPDQKTLKVAQDGPQREAHRNLPSHLGRRGRVHQRGLERLER